MTPSQAYKDEPFRFCDLPPEIRNMIYRLLLVKKKDIRRTELCGYRFQYDETWSVFSKPPNKREPRLQPAILLANRHINEEALAILYRENYFGVYVGPGRILHSNFLAFTDLQYLQAHPHFPLVRKLHARVDVSAFENLDETDHIGGLRAGVRRLVLTLLDRKPLAVLKISLLFGRLFDLGEKVYERMFEPLTLLQDLNRLEVMSKLFESLPNTLSDEEFSDDDDSVVEDAVLDGTANIKETNSDNDLNAADETDPDGNAGDDEDGAPRSQSDNNAA